MITISETIGKTLTKESRINNGLKKIYGLLVACENSSFDPFKAERPSIGDVSSLKPVNIQPTLISKGADNYIAAGRKVKSMIHGLIVKPNLERLREHGGRVFTLAGEQLADVESFEALGLNVNEYITMEYCGDVHKKILKNIKKFPPSIAQKIKAFEGTVGTLVSGVDEYLNKKSNLQDGFDLSFLDYVSPYNESVHNDIRLFSSNKNIFRRPLEQYGETYFFLTTYFRQPNTEDSRYLASMESKYQNINPDIENMGSESWEKHARMVFGIHGDVAELFSRQDLLAEHIESLIYRDTADGAAMLLNGWRITKKDIQDQLITNIAPARIPASLEIKKHEGNEGSELFKEEHKEIIEQADSVENRTFRIITQAAQLAPNPSEFVSTLLEFLQNRIPNKVISKKPKTKTKAQTKESKKSEKAKGHREDSASMASELIKLLKKNPKGLDAQSIHKQLINKKANWKKMDKIPSGSKSSQSKYKITLSWAKVALKRGGYTKEVVNKKRQSTSTCTLLALTNKGTKTKAARMRVSKCLYSKIEKGLV